jgi:tripartite-type tricarboxylate transporter receptor subunit TctC
MRVRSSLRGAAIAIAVSAGLLAGAAHAQDKYPSKPITIVVPYPPGGSNDVFARQVAKGLSEALKTPVVVDNKPGASGNIGTAFVAKSAPDGYTLAAVSSSMTTNAAVQPKMPFDPVKGFAPVAMFAKGPFIVAVNNDFPAKSPAELLAQFKARPGKYNYASSGNGSSNQFATELLKAMSGTDIVHVPYKGMGPAVTDLIGGQVQVLIASGPSLLPQVRGGKIKAIGITSVKANPIAPELMPMASAVPGYEFELWWGLLAPAGTPAEIVDRLNAAVNSALAAPAMKEYFLKEGAETTASRPAEFAKIIETDVARWTKLAKQQSITAD